MANILHKVATQGNTKNSAIRKTVAWIALDTGVKALVVVERRQKNLATPLLQR